MQDFFERQSQLTPQPSVYLLRYILHDWSTSYCVKILGYLRVAATPKTRLLVLDTVLPYAARIDPNTKGQIVEGMDLYTIPGAFPPQAPEPLLPNFGKAGLVPYVLDFGVSTILLYPSVPAVEDC
jgi:O-methyltransferase domain